jgi:hypothetical protein
VKPPRCPTTGKHSYSTLEWAVKAALHASKHRAVALRPYECGCGFWHITKNPGNRRVATVPGPFTPNDLARILTRKANA